MLGRNLDDSNLMPIIPNKEFTSLMVGLTINLCFWELYCLQNFNGLFRVFSCKCKYVLIQSYVEMAPFRFIFRSFRYNRLEMKFNFQGFAMQITSCFGANDSTNPFLPSNNCPELSTWFSL